MIANKCKGQAVRGVFSAPQVEIVLTFEEFCAEEGEFAGEGGSAFAAIFPLVRPSLSKKCSSPLPDTYQHRYHRPVLGSN